MKKILLLATGGTIACAGETALSPERAGEELVKKAGTVPSDCTVEARDLFSVDSTEITPKHWTKLVRAVRDGQRAFDGIVITHGTDTLAYTAAVLGYLCSGTGCPVVLTGSQRTFDEPDSDAPQNLRDALALAASDFMGTAVVFGGKVISALRAHKADTERFDGFVSVNAPLLGESAAEGVAASSARSSRLPEVPKAFDAKLAVLTVAPGVLPPSAASLSERGITGVILQGCGAGGLPESWLDEVRKTTESGICVVMTTQCVGGRVDLIRYRVGRAALEAGVISAGDMTLEAAYAKLLWRLSLGETPEAVRKAFATDFCGEITL